MTTKDKLIEKQKELIFSLDHYGYAVTDIAKLRKEIASLESELAKEETHTDFYDKKPTEKYLGELPKEQEPEGVTADPDRILAKWEGHEGLSLNDDRVRTGRMRVIAAMKEYAGIYSKSKQINLRDEDKT